MVSSQVGCSVIFDAVNISGSTERLFTRDNRVTGPGGAPDGVQATVKDNELPFMAPFTTFPLNAGTRLVPRIKYNGASIGIDKSKCVFIVPIIRNGQLTFLSKADFKILDNEDIPNDNPAESEQALGEGYQVKENEQLILGGAKYFVSVEDNT